MALKTYWRDFGRAALNLVYPPHCAGCGELDIDPDASGPTLCAQCLPELWRSESPCCQTCGESFHPTGSDSFECQTCRGRAFHFDFAVAPYQAHGVLRHLIHRFKYQGHVFLRPLLGQLLREVLQEPRLQALEPGWITVPVPLHPRRQRERSFNQAQELCRELTQHAGLPSINVLRRTRYTSSQTHYRRDRRLANLQGAFAPRQRKHLEGRTVALVDDVFTTGSTADACARALRESGAKKVVVITLARG